ncbi:C6 transcription factor [Colletotrichum sojae]|uniref:C6 transcription factor n=1 Tax=Colletotrichum sojae TaxID=2175907 RepID=A0A8H6J7T6_9PEZI|nr:C6 transcription factor [Colletotrichum sojae]
MRKPSACATCRARRRKCQTREGLVGCIYCSERGIKCVQKPPPGGYYEQRENQRKQNEEERQQHHHRQQQGSQGSQGSQGHASVSPGSHASGRCSRCETTPHARLPSLPIRLDLVRLYFDYVHDQFHSLFHRPSFVEDALADRVPEGILYGICALSARFSTDPVFADIDPRDRVHGYLQAAEKCLNIRDVSLTTIQLCVLIGAAWTADGNGEAENIYYGVACRMAQLLDLPSRPATSLLEREVNIRGKCSIAYPPPRCQVVVLQGTTRGKANTDRSPVWWSLCMIDVWSSTAVKLPKLLPARSDIPLPMDDLPFLSLSRSGGPAAAATAAASLSSQHLSQMVRLNRILLDVNDFNQRCVAENPGWDALEQGVEALGSRMEAWLAALPDNMRDTPENFAWFAARGLGRTFAAVYLGYYHFGQLLYYQFLYGAAATTAINPAAPASVARRDSYAKKCKDHAARLCEVVYRAQTTPAADVRYTMAAHVLVIASTVQIHTLLFSGDEADIRTARRRLERNFELVLQLRCYWPTVDRAIGRLRAFHETARTSVDTSFVLDRWMLRFLVEFAEPMEEKDAEAVGAGRRAGDDADEMESLWTMEGLRS